MHEQIALEGVNRRGRKIVCQVTCSPLLDHEAGVSGAIIVMDELSEGHFPDRAAP